MAETLVLHESVLALGTEGYFFGENSLDVRLPHWPASQSGVTIGVGFDIGASGITASELDILMATLGVPQAMINVLKPAIGKQASGSSDPSIINLMNQHQMRQRVRLSQQQALDIMLVIKQKHVATAKRSFPRSYGVLHPAIIEALVKISYGAPALLAGWAAQKWSGLGPMFDQVLAGQNHLQQCRTFIDQMMRAMQNHAWPSSSVKDIHGTRIPRGLASFIEGVHGILAKGGKVEIQKGPINIDDLLSPNNKTIDIAAQVTSKTHAGNVTGASLRGNLQKARNEEPQRMKAVCTALACPVPVLDKSNLNTETMTKVLSVLSKGKINYEHMKIQEALVRLGWYDKAGISGGMRNADGNFGTNSRRVLVLFQQDWLKKNPTGKMASDGSIDAMTKQVLLKPQAQNNSGQNNNNGNNNQAELAQIPSVNVQMSVNPCLY